MEWGAPATQLAAFITLTVVSADIIRRLIRNRIERKGYPLPPGPTPLPFIGSVLSINAREPFRSYTEWRAKYGDIMYIRLLDMDVVVLNSFSVINDLFEKRSQVYSDRPSMATLHSGSRFFRHGHDINFGMARYGDQWRLCRRIFHQTFRAETAASFHPLQLHVARQMVLNMVEEPGNYASHYTTFGAVVTMRSVYDYDPSPKDDPVVSVAREFLKASIPSIIPERAVLFKVFPFILHIPDWLPGSSIKREARKARELSAKMIEEPYQYVQKRMESEEYVNPSMVSDHITRLGKFDDSYRSVYERGLKMASSTAFLGSIETTSSLLMTFTLAMVKNPRIWKRAQADIDAVVGTDRLPDFGDRSSLPYIEAIVREIMRWQPPIPLAVHATSSSDIYNGFYIPKGAVVFGNVWGMSRDETRYPMGDEFIPERFLDTTGMLTDDIPDFVFGWGRRICPGRYAADSSLWIAIATLLATLDFNPAKDVDGRDVSFEAKYINGLARSLSTFPCHLVPRSHIGRTSLERVLGE